jgi:hypothetical protein
MLGFSPLDATALAATGLLNVTVAVTGVEATGAVGTVVVVAKAVVPVVGVEATGQVGTVVVVAEANVLVTGVEAAGQVGTVTIIAEAVVPVVGVAAIGCCQGRRPRCWGVCCWAGRPSPCLGQHHPRSKPQLDPRCPRSSCSVYSDQPQPVPELDRYCCVRIRHAQFLYIQRRF